MIDSVFVSIIVVNWNGKTVLSECLDALSKQTYPHREIIVVDNHSTDGSVPWLQQQGQGIKRVLLTENRGFSGGNAAGLSVALGEYIALLNNDTVPDPNWLADLVSAMDQDERVGSCASKLVTYSPPHVIDSAGDECLTYGHGIKRGEGQPESAYTQREFVFGACAGAVLYRRKMIGEVGFFDEDFFLNCEDADLNFRAQLMGWKCLYIPTARVRHRVSATIGRLSDTSVYYAARNSEWVWIKNMPTGLMIRSFHYKVIEECGALVYFALQGKLWVFLRGKADAFKKLPTFLKKRKDIQKRKTVSNRYLRTVLTPICSAIFRGMVRQRFLSVFPIFRRCIR